MANMTTTIKRALVGAGFKEVHYNSGVWTRDHDKVRDTRVVVYLPNQSRRTIQVTACHLSPRRKRLTVLYGSIVRVTDPKGTAKRTLERARMAYKAVSYHAECRGPVVARVTKPTNPKGNGGRTYRLCLACGLFRWTVGPNGTTHRPSRHFSPAVA